MNNSSIEQENSHYHFHQLYVYGMIIELTVFAHIWANIITHALWG